jgi:tetratricopeptide (TPR) repeat protein
MAIIPYGAKHGSYNYK